MNRHFLYVSFLLAVLSMLLLCACSAGTANDRVNTTAATGETTAAVSEKPAPSGTTSASGQSAETTTPIGTETAAVTEPEELTSASDEPQVWTDEWSNLY